MNCIFCNTEFDEKKVPAEHIIPNSVGGTVVTYDVCDVCNHLFSSFDVDLHRHRHIYDSYKTLNPDIDLNLEFRFIDSFVNHTDGSIIKVLPKSSSNEIIPSLIHDDTRIYDLKSSEKNDTYILHVRKIQKKYNLSNDFINKFLQRYLTFKNNAVNGSVYRDDFLTNKLEIHIESTEGKKQTIMNAKTPLRFISKACVEYCYLLGIQDQISNLDTIKEYALKDNSSSCNLRFYQDITSNSNGVPFHFIFFNDRQFCISFFGKWGTAVEITWKDNPNKIYLANDILNKRLKCCCYENGEVTTTDDVLMFPKHASINRPSHIRR